MSEPVKSPPPRVLFCCTQNALRSPMAVGLLRLLLGPDARVDSAGVMGAALPDGFMVAVMREVGVNMNGHHPQTFAAVDVGAHDVAVALSRPARDALEELTAGAACRALFWDVPDPSMARGPRAARLDAYRAVRDDLRGRIAAEFG